jgi:adenine deaminase
MALAARRMQQLGGGIVVGRDGAVLAEVALPVFGQLDDGPLEDTIAACRAVAHAIADIGCPDPDVVSNAAFATLPRSLPRLKLTSHGLVRVFREGPRELVPLVISASQG